MPEIDWTVLMQGYLRKRLYTMNENSFIHIFHQGYRRFALTLSTFLEHLLSLSFSLAWLSHLRVTRACRNQRTSLAHTQKMVTHTHARTYKEHAHTENEVERFLGDFSMYTHMYIPYTYIYTYLYV